MNHPLRKKRPPRSRHRNRRAPRPAPVGCFVRYQIVRLGIGGLCCAIFGLGLLGRELSEPAPELWGILSALLIGLLSLLLLGLMP